VGREVEVCERYRRVMRRKAQLAQMQLRAAMPPALEG